MNAPKATNRPHPQQQQPLNSNGNNGGVEHGGNGPHRLTPQEAALRGASLAFQKQQQGAKGGLSRQTTGTGAGNGRVSRQTTGSSTRPERDGGDAAAEKARDRERQALFLPAPAAADQGKGPHPDPKSASFIAATLAASRSVSPGSGPGSRGESEAGTARRRSPPRELADLRRNSTAAADDRTDTTSLPPATSLISMFESQGHADVGPVKSIPDRPVGRKPKLRSSQPHMRLEQEDESLDQGNSTEHNPKAKAKPSPKPKPKGGPREETPPPTVISRADTEIVSPKPRRPKIRPNFAEAAAVSSESNENSDAPTKESTKAKPKVPKPRTAVARDKAQRTAGQGENQAMDQRLSNVPTTTPATPTKTRPPAPRKSAVLPERMALELNKQNARRQSVVSNLDGQEGSKRTSAEDTTDARPSTADSKSSNDSFVSASSVPTRDETDSLLTMGRSTPSSLTPKAAPSRPISTQPHAPAFPIRRSATGPSQLPLDSLSDAIMAGSLASARHTPALSDSRTPPPLPPSRRKGGTKYKASSRRQSPHRMRHTLRQPMSLSDDEDARRPHHRKGLNNKKHAHHEGSRRRWREEITEREKRRYEAVWASNRGLFLVPSQAWSDPEHHPEHHPQDHEGRQPLRNESHEELSEHVANVVVRDLWSRSRLPAAELAEVWDLVHGRGRPPERVVHAALNKQEFVVGMWLIDQRLRGRKIPPRVSESVWDSAKGLRVLSPEHGQGHGHKGKGK